MLTIITEISSLTEAEIYSISQLPKQLNPTVKQGKHFPSVQWALDSPWAVCPSAPEALQEPQQPSREFWLCAEPAKLAQSQPCTPVKKPQAQEQPDMAATIPQLEADNSAEAPWSREPQQLPGVKISAAEPARNSACSYLGIYTALPTSSTLSTNLSSFSAELIMCDWHKRQNFNTDV